MENYIVYCNRDVFTSAVMCIYSACPPKYLWLRAIATHGKKSPPVVINIYLRKIYNKRMRLDEGFSLSPHQRERDSNETAKDKSGRVASCPHIIDPRIGR